MTVKALTRLLTTHPDDMEVLIRPKLAGYTLAESLFSVSGIRETLEPDTSERIVLIECDQEED